MHDSFADWYSPASVRPDLAELQARSAAVEATAAKLVDAPLDAVGLVEAVFDRGLPLTRLEWFLKSLKAADPTLRLDDNDNMLNVLAGCVLGTLMTAHDVDWSEVANAVRCASLAGARAPRVARHLPKIADACLARWQVKGRAAPELGAPPKLGSVQGIFDAAHAKMIASPDQATLIEGVKAIGTQMAELTRAHSRRQDAYVEKLSRQVLQQREELDMLWWVLGGWVEELELPLSAIPPESAPIVVGWCLGGLVRVTPQPRALPAIVARALAQVPGVGSDKVPLAVAIKAVPEVLKRAYGRPAANLVPHFLNVAPVCVALAQAAEDPERWEATFERTTGLGPETPLPPRTLAEQLCAERTLIRQFEG